MTHAIEHDTERAASGPREPDTGTPRVLAVPWAMVREFLDHVFAEPFREGRLRARGWPVGLRTIVAVSATAYVAAITLMVLGSEIRATMPLSTEGGTDFSFPRPVLWIVWALVALSLALVQTAALHVSVWLRITSTTIVAASLVSLSTTDSDPVGPARIAAISGASAIVLVTILRKRAAFAWWEFAVVFALIGGTMALTIAAGAQSAARTGIDLVPILLALLITTIGQLAIPSAIAAGAAVGAVAGRSALWAVAVVRRHLPPTALWVLLAVVLAWRLWDTAIVLDSGVPLDRLAASAVLVAAVALTWWLLSRRRRVQAPYSSTASLATGLERIARPFAVGFAVTFAPIIFITVVMQIAFAYGAPLAVLEAGESTVALLRHSVAIMLVRLMVGIVLLVLAMRWARTHDSLLPEVMGAAGATTTLAALPALLGMPRFQWSAEGLAVVTVVLCIGLLGWMLITRTLGGNRLVGIVVTLLASSLFLHRDFVSDPISAILGFTGVAIVLFGYLWSFLTSGETANASSLRYPQPSRVMLFLANLIFGVTVLAVVVLSRNPDATLNLGGFAVIGDRILGTSLIVAILVAVTVSIVRDREPVLEEAAQD